MPRKRPNRQRTKRTKRTKRVNSYLVRTTKRTKRRQNRVKRKTSRVKRKKRTRGNIALRGGSSDSARAASIARDVALADEEALSDEEALANEEAYLVKKLTRMGVSEEEVALIGRESALDQEVDMGSKRQFIVNHEPEPEPALTLSQVYTGDVVIDNPVDSIRGSDIIGEISGHGRQIEDEFTIVPEGMTFYLYSSSGEVVTTSIIKKTHAHYLPPEVIEQLTRQRDTAIIHCDRYSKWADEIKSNIKSIHDQSEPLEGSNHERKESMRAEYIKFKSIIKENVKSEESVKVEEEGGRAYDSIAMNILVDDSIPIMVKKHLCYYCDDKSVHIKEKIDKINQSLSKYEGRRNHLREYKSGSLIPNYNIDFDVKWDDGAWMYGGILIGDQNKFVNPASVYFDSGYTIDEVLVHHDESYITKEEIKESSFFELSYLFKIISERKGPKPSKWVGSFCRSGKPFDIDDLKACSTQGYESLPADFFAAKISSKDLGLLLRENSLSSNVRMQNFRVMMEYVMQHGDPEDIILYNLKGVLYNFDPITISDVCYILQAYAENELAVHGNQ